MKFLNAWLQRSPLLLWAYVSLRNGRYGKRFDSAGLKNAFYDRQALAVMKRTLAPDSICIDGGAHVGSFLELMCRVAPLARHHAIEPLPHLHQSLLQRFERHHIYRCALGEQAGSAVFRHVVNASAYSGLQERPYDGIDAQITELAVDVVRLDDLIPADQAIALIKLDLEGGEYHALRGGITLIRRTQPLIIFECGSGSCAAYGVDMEMMYTLITGELGYR